MVLVTFTEEILNGKFHIVCSDGVVLEILTNSSDSGGFQGFSMRFLSFDISKVRASVCVTIYTTMYNITVRIYVKNYCKSLLVY